VPDEHEHAVPPLEVPTTTALSEVQETGAVQMFVQHARKVKATFSLTSDNAADVVTVCRRLDGLPLAIELAAARSKVLSPSALLTRLDKALDISAVGGRGPSRQKTLRDTIDWSYRLLTGDQQVFFRRLGVFSGGADLDAIDAIVNADEQGSIDVLDGVSELMDASLITITENASGEPRVGMLETIRAYALDQLTEAAELDQARRTHAQHFAHVAETLRSRITGHVDHVLAARRRYEVEQDNLREAMRWALAEPEPQESGPNRATLGLALCAPQVQLWMHVGYYTEARQWLERVVNVAADQPSRDLARCLHGLAIFLASQGDCDRARQLAARTVAMCRHIGDEVGVLVALNTLAEREREADNLEAACSTYEEGIALAKRARNSYALGLHLVNLADLESEMGNHERALALTDRARGVAVEIGDDYGALWVSHARAKTLRRMGKLSEAHEQTRDHLDKLLRLADPDLLMAQAEEYAALLGDSHPRMAARMLGAVDARREQDQLRRSPARESEITHVSARIHAALAQADWQHEYETGRNTTVDIALTEAGAASSTLTTHD
jgi:predicted ATPase